MILGSRRYRYAKMMRTAVLTPRGRAAVTPATIFGSSLAGWWKLDEVSGSRADSSGNGLTLTDTNTVTQAAGRVGSAAQFTAANSEYLSRADEALLDAGDIDFAWACWVYADTLGADRYVFSKNGNAGNRHDYELFYNNGASRFVFRSFIQSIADYKSVTASTLGAPSTATWYFIVCWHDAAADTLNIQVDNGTVDSASTAGVALEVSDGGLGIGARGDLASDFWNGRIDEVVFAKTVPTAAQRTALYQYGGGT